MSCLIAGSQVRTENLLAVFTAWNDFTSPRSHCVGKANVLQSGTVLQELISGSELCARAKRIGCKRTCNAILAKATTGGITTPTGSRILTPKGAGPLSSPRSSPLLRKGQGQRKVHWVAWPFPSHRPTKRCSHGSAMRSAPKSFACRTLSVP